MPETMRLSVEMRQETPIPLDVTFACAQGDVLGIYGPSGSGKTTILRTIAGLYRPRHARVSCNGTIWTDTSRDLHVATHRRKVGFVFQDYALFPHLTARGNVLASLADRPAPVRAQAADAWLDTVHLTGLASRRPAELSGGQRQRVALARALAREPDVLLLDEPFAAIDRAVRHRLHEELNEIRRRVHMPIVLVTHDFRDVLRLATHVLILDRGTIVALGPLADVSSRADLPWADQAIGAGSVIETTVRGLDEDRGLAELAFAGGVLRVPMQGLREGASVRVRVPAREVILAIRPPEGLSVHNVLAGHIDDVGPDVGGQVLLRVVIGEIRLLAQITGDAVRRLALAEGAAVFALVKSVSIDVYDSRPEVDRDGL